MAPYARLFTTGAFQELSTADNGYYVAIVKMVIAESGPRSEATAIEALEGVKISDHDLRSAKAIGVAVVELIREEALKEKNVGLAVVRARTNPKEHASKQAVPNPPHDNLDRPVTGSSTSDSRGASADSSTQRLEEII